MVLTLLQYDHVSNINSFVFTFKKPVTTNFDMTLDLVNCLYLAPDDDITTTRFHYKYLLP